MRLCGVLLLLLIGACASPLSNAKLEFRNGHYAEAKALLESGEHESYSERELLEYELFRGLVHHALGDQVRANQWLTRAQIHDRAAPALLKDEDRTRLKLALEAVKDAR
jgi:hypothetical protein